MHSLALGEDLSKYLTQLVWLPRTQPCNSQNRKENGLRNGTFSKGKDTKGSGYLAFLQEIKKKIKKLDSRWVQSNVGA